MARTYNITRRNQTEQRENGRNKQVRTPNKHQDTNVIPRSNTVFRKVPTEFVRKNG